MVIPKKTPASWYTREYFLSEARPSEFERFKKGGRPEAVYLKAFEYIPEDIKGPFLDIGCGRGELVIYLARLGKRAYGIDYSPAAIRICQEILRSEKKSVRTLAKFQSANCTNLPFENNTFQCVFLMDIVEHLTLRQLKLTLKEANRVLKSQGVLIVHTNNKYFEKITKLFIAAFYHGTKVLFKPKKTLKEATSSPYEYLHINCLTGGELLRYLKEVGFRARIEYVKPRKKAELKKFVAYPEGRKKDLFYNIAWFLLNSPLIKFLSPTFWIIARKKSNGSNLDAAGKKLVNNNTYFKFPHSSDPELST